MERTSFGIEGWVKGLGRKKTSLFTNGQRVFKTLPHFYKVVPNLIRGLRERCVLKIFFPCGGKGAFIKGWGRSNSPGPKEVGRPPKRTGENLLLKGGLLYF